MCSNFKFIKERINNTLIWIITLNTKFSKKFKFKEFKYLLFTIKILRENIEKKIRFCSIIKKISVIFF